MRRTLDRGGKVIVPAFSVGRTQNLVYGYAQGRLKGKYPDLPIYVDDTLLECEAVILGGGSRSKKIKVAPEVFSRLPGASIVPGLSSG